MGNKKTKDEQQSKPTSIVFFSTQQWVEDSFKKYETDTLKFRFLETKLSEQTVSLAQGHDVVCVFVNDTVDTAVISSLKEYGIKLIALRCAGFNNVDIQQAEQSGITIARVPAYSPYAVAEHALGLILTLNRKYHRSYSRVREGNFSLNGLLGFDLNQKTVGVIGTGQIGIIFAKIMQGLNCNVIAYDPFPNKELEALGIKYVSLETLYKESDIVSLHCPLSHQTYHIINDYAIKTMKPGVMIINTSRGPLINSSSIINGLKKGIIGAVGLDVYEEEGDLFFEDLSGQVIHDDTFVRLQTFPNVIITSHQAFFTQEAVDNIAQTTMENIKEYIEKGSCTNSVQYTKISGSKA